MKSLRVLGIETSCDETGVAIVDSESGLLAHRLHSQVDLHARYGGVVPELASRDHIHRILPLMEEVMAEAESTPQQIDAVAYTAGPGLIGALMVGAMVGRSLAMAWGVPALAIHHMEGHLLAPMLEEKRPPFPFVALLVSGGHTQLVEVASVGDYRLLGESLDDAAGEAFDKAAKMLGLPYPGGPALAKLAESGDSERFPFPRPMVDRPGLEFSFSGLKTACLNCVTACRKAGELDDQARADIAAGYQKAIVETLAIKCRRALRETGVGRLVIAGGVSANTLLRERLEKMVTKEGAELYYPALAFCTDNGAMIALAGLERLKKGEHAPLAVEVRPRWPLTDLATPGC